MNLTATLNGIDYIVHVTDYDYSPYRPATGPTYSSGGDPPEPEEFVINDGYLELDCQDCPDLTQAILGGEKNLFWLVVEANAEDLELQAIEQIRDEQDVHYARYEDQRGESLW